MKKTKENNNLTKLYIIFATVVVIIIAAACFCVHSAYHKGTSDGRADYEQETAELLSNLGNAISEKSEFNQNASKILTDVPNDINGDGMEVYIKNLLNLSDSVHTDAIKSALESYIKSWQDFKDLYASEDNSAIAPAFDEIKNEATVIATQIREIYDNQISDALRKLGSN